MGRGREGSERERGQREREEERGAREGEREREKEGFGRGRRKWEVLNRGRIRRRRAENDRRIKKEIEIESR